MKTLILCSVLACEVLAHDLYLMPAKFSVKPGESVLVSVHSGDSFPASEGPTDPSRLQTSLSEMRILGRATHGFARIEKPGAIVLHARTAPRTFELAPEKFEAYLKEEGLDHVIEWRKQHGESGKPGRETYVKYAKSVLMSGEAGEGYQQAAGLPLEFIPEVDPFHSKSLPVRVLFRGTPAAGLQIEKAHSSGKRWVVGRTDADGRIVVPIDAAGKWRLHAVHMERVTTSPDADWLSHWASLTFERR